MTRADIRLGLPSKGTLSQGALSFLARCGLAVYRPNPRQYVAAIPALPELTVMFQRPGDIVAGVREGSLDFGISGWDIIQEKKEETDDILPLHDALGFAPCTLNLAVPEDQPVQSLADMQAWSQARAAAGRPLRVATKYPSLTGRFLEEHSIKPFKLITVEGTLEIAPSIGFADLIADLVSSGVTLRDNHLRIIIDGEILSSQASLIANRTSLRERPSALEIARKMLEYIEAHLRAEGSFQITANMRGQSAQAIAAAMRDKRHIAGLQGPTISQVITHNGESWFAINIIVRRSFLFEAIAELRAIGGSGVIVTPCSYIFEEEPARYQAMLAALR